MSSTGLLHDRLKAKAFDRMFREMDEAACPAPEYRQNEFMVYATLRQHQVVEKLNGELNGTLNGTQQIVYDCIKANPGIQVQHRIIASGNLTVDEMNSFFGKK